MTAVAGTAEYAREWQRRRTAGESTVGLAEQMRDGTVVPEIAPKKLRQAQQMYRRGLGTAAVMRAAGVTYAQCQDIRASMG